MDSVTHKPKEYLAYGLKYLFCHKLHHLTKVCHNKTSLPRQKNSMRTQRTFDHDSQTDTKSRQKLDEIQKAAHTSQSDPNSNDNHNSYQSIFSKRTSN